MPGSAPVGHGPPASIERVPGQPAGRSGGGVRGRRLMPGITIDPVPIYEFECERCGHRFEELVGSHVGTEATKLPAPSAARARSSACSRPPTRRSPADDPEPAAPARGQARHRPRRRQGAFQASSARPSGARPGAGRARERRASPGARRSSRSTTRRRSASGARSPRREPGRLRRRQRRRRPDVRRRGARRRGGPPGTAVRGRAGGFLTELLEGIGLKREDVFITNVLKCRPPGNRDPQPDEIESCRPWLEQRRSS